MNPDADPHFLVVDDQPTMRRVMQALLKDIGFEHVAAAPDGGVAMQMLRRSRFDLVITDILMPNMDGLQLLAAIRADDDLKHLPVLAVAAEARQDEVARSMEGGATACLVKPFTRTELEARVRAVLEGPAQGH